MKTLVAAACLLLVMAACSAYPRGGRGAHHRRGQIESQDICRMARHACLVIKGTEIVKETNCGGNATCNKVGSTEQHGEDSYSFTFCSERPEKCGPEKHRRGKRPSSRPAAPSTTQNPQGLPQIQLPPHTDSQAETELCMEPLWKASACLIVNTAGEELKNLSCEHNGLCTAGPGEYTDDQVTVTAYFCQGCEDDSEERNGKSSESGESSEESDSSDSDEDSAEERQGPRVGGNPPNGARQVGRGNRPGDSPTRQRANGGRQGGRGDRQGDNDGGQQLNLKELIKMWTWWLRSNGRRPF